MLLSRLLACVLSSSVAWHGALAAGVAGRGPAYAESPQQWIIESKGPPLQNIVTWDADSLLVRGERIVIYSGEFHPFRLPVPALWLDIFQKIKSMGYNCVSFYVHWAVLEGNPGEFSAQGVFAFEPFFDAAKKAGIYLLARPGPYINAEVSGGGYPGWLQRVKGTLRSADQDYLQATENYVQKITQIIAKAQITNGGPVILFQPENEYTVVGGSSAIQKGFPDPVYWSTVQEQYRRAGIIVPFISNDASAKGFFAPDHPIKNVSVDIYGHDAYPLGFDCANPYTWPTTGFPTTWTTDHENQSPSTPYSIIEFQGGAFDPWGGPGFEKCSILVNHEYERVFYKNNFGFGVKIYNVYMTYGGTNWGNLGHPGGYTSYDYGSVITEDRQVYREKYSEAKLEANFLKVSPAYLTAKPGTRSTTAYTDRSDLAVTPLWGNKTNFYVIRHSDYTSRAKTQYKLNLRTSIGNLTVPLFGGSLTLDGRDSKIYVTDYNIGDSTLVYSTAEIFTWKKYQSKTVLIVYGDSGEHHELAIAGAVSTSTIEGDGVTTKVYRNTTTVLAWDSTPTRKVVKVSAQGRSDLYVYLLNRNSAYNYWVLDLAGPDGTLFPSGKASSVIAKAGYLLRNVTVTEDSLSLVGDFNATTSIEILGGAPRALEELNVNGEPVYFNLTVHDVAEADFTYRAPSFTLPKLGQLQWKYIDTLPEIKSSYEDDDWVSANLSKTANSKRNLTTPTSLYSSDYGFHTGTLIYRGHFKATGNETTFYVQAQGGSGFGFSVWVDSTYLGSFAGFDAASSGNSTFTLPSKLTAGNSHVFTVLIDNMGLDENWIVGLEEMKNPRGILNFELAGHPKKDITWKLTGNLGGEEYRDKIRGPLNEGGLFAERQGYHLPSPPSGQWARSGGPTEGISAAGVGFFATSFDLNLPNGYDIPLAFVFANATTTNSTAKASAYRAQLFVNGYQFGKYVHNIGPQGKFPVPEGILNHHGKNWLAVSLWSQEKNGAKLDGFELEAQAAVLSGYGSIASSPTNNWAQRQDAY